MAGNKKQVDTITKRDKQFFKRNAQIGGVTAKLSGRDYAFENQDIGRLAREKSLQVRRANRVSKEDKS